MNVRSRKALSQHQPTIMFVYTSEASTEDKDIEFDIRLLTTNGYSDGTVSETGR